MAVYELQCNAENGYQINVYACVRVCIYIHTHAQVYWYFEAHCVINLIQSLQPSLIY